MTRPIIFDHFGFTYAVADKPAIDDVSLEVAPGRVTSVIAPQGMGKTTLLRGVAGLLGNVFHGESRGAISGELDQRPGAFFDGYVQVTLTVETVREEIGLPLMAAGIGRVERERRVDAVARELSITNLVDRNVTALSGGEEKLVGIAAALVCDAKVFVLDEPFEQLDVHHSVAVIRAIKRRARAGAVVLVATGSLDTAINIADAAICHHEQREGSARPEDGSLASLVMTGWRYVSHPSYADIDGAASAVGRIAERKRPFSSIHRFREAVL
jgi:energy-coupling factor transporter ATP-binding protein EcfA2